MGREEVRAAILDSAGELFAERGPAATAIRDIATRARVNHGLVFRHFGTKEQLVAAVLNHQATQLTQLIGTHAPVAELTTAGTRQLHVIARALLDGFPVAQLQTSFPAAARLIDQIEKLHASRDAARLAAAHATALLLGWQMFEPFIRAAHGLPDLAQDDLRQSMFVEMGRLAAPPTPEETSRSVVDLMRPAVPRSEMISFYPESSAAPSSPRAVTARQRILAAAREELVDTGDLEIAGLCRRAGVSMGLPYRYFANRNGVLVAVVDDFYLRLWHAATGREYSQPTWVEREQARIRDWIGFLTAEPLSVLVLGGLTGDSAVAAANERQLGELVERVASDIAHAQQQGELRGGRDPQLLAAVVVAGVHAATTTAMKRDQRPTPQELFTQIWQVVAGAVGLA
jgi:TetR/AcrR family transcriptional regulator, repressor for neighboring sulfatase